MAYQPKYAQKNTARPRETEARPPKQKKTVRVGFVLFVLLGCIVVPVSCFATWQLMVGIYENVGRPKPQQVQTAQLNVAQDLADYVANALADTRNVLLAAERPKPQEPGIPEEEVPQETVKIEPVRKRYWIEEGTLVAPEPNQSCYGETEDPSTLGWLLEEAAWILEDQELYFDLNVQIFAGSKVMYYLDDSIFAITWKEVHDGSVYTFSEVKISHPSQFRRYLAGGEYGSNFQFKTTEMAQSVNAVVASSGDFYRHRDFGAVVYEGQAKRVEGTYAETCYIDGDGDMHFTYAEDVLTVQEVQDFVDKHNIQFSLAFGPVLVDQYEVIPHTWYGVGEITEGYARAALCQMGDLHYIVATANTEGPWQEIPTVALFQKHIAATGCRMAYCLDGGQTAAIVMNDQLINRPVYGEQRKISDIIYFATAVPEGG